MRPSSFAPSFILFALAACGGAEPKKVDTAATPAASTEVTATAPTSATPATTAQVATPKVPEGPAYTFTKADPRIGTVVTDKKNIAMNMDVAGHPVNESEKALTVATVKGAAGPIVTDLEVTYREHVRSNDAAKSIVLGKTYRVKWVKDQLVITDAKGKPAPAADALILKKDFASEVGKSDPLVDAMPARPIHIGEAVPELSAALVNLMAKKDSGDDPMTVTDSSFVLREVKDGHGVFDVSFTMGSEKLHLKIRLTGDITLRQSDSLTESAHLSGPLEMQLPDAGKVTGTMQMMMDRTFK